MKEFLPMTPEDFRQKIVDLQNGKDGKVTDKMLAHFLNVSTADIRRYKKGKLPPRYRRKELFEKVKNTWVHYEGRADEEPELCERK